MASQGDGSATSDDEVCFLEPDGCVVLFAHRGTAQQCCHYSAASEKCTARRRSEVNVQRQ